VLKQGYPEIELVLEIRKAFLALLPEGDSAGLVAGLAIGERGRLSDEVANQMRELSLTHLVAVSGANLAIVMAAVWFVLAALGAGRHIRFAVSLVGMVCYVLIVGPESSVIRSATMASFVMAAMCLGRGSNPMHALSAAVITILLIDPGMATDFGFSLSAMVTTGLLIAATPIFEVLKPHLPQIVALGAAATIAAQLYTTPILLMLQPGLPLYSVIANLLAGPVVAPVTVLGITSVALALPAPWVSLLLNQLAMLGTSVIVWVAETLSGLPFVRLHFVSGAWGVAVAFGLVLLITLYLTAQQPRIRKLALKGVAGTVLLGALLSLFEIGRYNTSFDGWDVIACDVGQGDALLIRSRGEVALIDFGPDEAALARCLRDAGVERIHLAVISHYDADHVAGVDGLSATAVGLALLPGFEDDRPLKEKVVGFLSEAGAQAQIGQVGMTGSLGACVWSILMPSASAKEASDSNDASLVAKFDCPLGSILALGDLGEAGQQRLISSGRLSFTPNTILKVAHHGSADQSRVLHELVRPSVAVISVGKNRYGHPSDRILRILSSLGTRVFRTDQSGHVAMRFSDEGIGIRAAGKLAG